LFERRLEQEEGGKGQDGDLPAALPDYIVDEFYILHETIRHMITDLRSQPVSGDAAHNTLCAMANATLELRNAVKNPKCTMVDLVIAGRLVALQEEFHILKTDSNQTQRIHPDCCFVEKTIDEL